MLNLYVDSADRTAAEPLLESGCFAGLTTNPTLLQAAGVQRAQLGDLVGWAVAAGAQTVFLQSWGASAGEIVRHGRELRDLGEQVVVKVPVTTAGLEAAAALEGEGTPVLVTAVYAASQVLPVLAAGSSYVAPYLGRMQDAGRDGLGEITAMQRAVSASGCATRILVASLRDPGGALSLASFGVRDFTIAPPLWNAFVSDPLTNQAVEVFEQAAASI